MELSNVKAITIPEGEVKKITINGNVVWRKDRLRTWNVTIDADKSSLTTLVTDNWLKEHRADANLIVIATPKFLVEAPTSNYYTSMSFGSNHTPMQSDDLYSAMIRGTIKSDGTASSSATTGTYSIAGTKSTTAGYMYITEDGELQINASSTYKIPKGEWIVQAIILGDEL